MKKLILIILTIVIFQSFVSGFLISDQGTNVKDISSGNLTELANLTIQIYDEMTGGSLIFEQELEGTIINGSWNVMINPDLKYGVSYYKDYQINGEDLDFDGNERIQFQSAVGEINNVSFINFSLINSCAAGSSIRLINSNGTVECETDDSGGSSDLTNYALKNQSEIFAGNITTTESGLFGWLGNLVSRITKLFVQDIDFNGTISGSGNITTTGNITADYYFGDGSQLTNLPSGAGDNSSWNESYADTKYLQTYSESDPSWTANYTAYNDSWSTDTDTTYSHLSNFTDDLGARGYTHLSNFTDDLAYSGDNSSWNESYADTKYLQSYTESDPSWTANYTAYNSSWSSTYNSTYDVYNSTGLIQDWNASGLIRDDNSTGLIINWTGVGDTDTTYTAGSNLTLTGTEFDANMTSIKDYFDLIYAAIGSVFSGSWNDLTDVPAGFSDGVDNDTTYTHLSNFTDDQGFYNASDFDINDYSTTADILGFGYYNSTDFDIADYLTSAEVLAFNYYNSTDFDIANYFTSAQILGFDYYNSTDFVITDYYTKTEIDGFSFYNITDFDIANYFTKSDVLGFGYYNSTNPPIESDPSWTANYTAYNDSWTTTDAEIWAIAANGTLMPYSAWNATNDSYYLVSNPFGFYNSTNPPTESDPSWTANYTAYNSSWSSTYNSTYDAYNSTGLIKDWNESGYIINWSGVGDTDTTYTVGSNLSLDGTEFSVNMSSIKDYFDLIYAAIGSVFSGSWNDLTDVPEGFSDGVDNDTTFTNSSPISLSGTTFGLETCADNQILKMNGASWNCEADAEGSGGGNPFDQVLNTTSNVTFVNVTATGNITAGNIKLIGKESGNILSRQNMYNDTIGMIVYNDSSGTRIIIGDLSDYV